MPVALLSVRVSAMSATPEASISPNVDTPVTPSVPPIVVFPDISAVLLASRTPFSVVVPATVIPVVVEEPTKQTWSRVIVDTEGDITYVAMLDI